MNTLPDITLSGAHCARGGDRAFSPDAAYPDDPHASRVSAPDHSMDGEHIPAADSSAVAGLFLSEGVQPEDVSGGQESPHETPALSGEGMVPDERSGRGVAVGMVDPALALGSPRETTGGALVRTYAADTAEAHQRAAQVEQFLALTRPVSEGGEGLSGRQAAEILNVGASFWAGPRSIVARYQAEGTTALTPQRHRAGRPAQYSPSPEVLRAMQRLYLRTNRSRGKGSVQETARSYAMPNAVTAGLIQRMELPPCPPELARMILEREAAGLPLLPPTLAKQVASAEAVVQMSRNATEARLDYLSAAGTTMFRDPTKWEMIQGGDVVECDDATVNMVVCVPWTIRGDKCSERYGVRVGRFQWLVSRCAGSRFVPAFTYVMRGRDSYRAEDVLGLMRAVIRSVGVPREWRLEQGAWKADMVQQCARLLGTPIRTVYSPHQKPYIEGLFNLLWTKLSLMLDGQVGRYRGEMERENDLLRACQAGAQDPREHFPMLADVMAAMAASLGDMHRTPVRSKLYGTWVPEERWAADTAARPLRQISPAEEWMFHPMIREWTVRGNLVGGMVPVFGSDLPSVPFDFSAPILPMFHGAKVRAHFDPAARDCAATLVLMQNWGDRRAGEIIATAPLANEVAGYARMVLGWGGEERGAAVAARRAAGAEMRRATVLLAPGGRVVSASHERTDGLTREISEAAPTTRASQPVTPEPARMRWTEEETTEAERILDSI